MCAALVNGASQQFRAHHNLDHTTRANISHEEAEQIRARIVCTPAKKRWAGVDKVNALTGQNLYILFCLFAELGLCLAGVGASTTRMVGELTHMRSMCVGVAETGGEHCSPAKRTLKEKYHK